MLGLLLGALLFFFGLFNLSTFNGLVQALPPFLLQIVSPLQNLSFFWNQILFLLAAFFLWKDAARKTRVFNGMVSIVAGCVALLAALGGHLQGVGILSLPIPLSWNPLLSMVLGVLLVYDSVR